MIFELAGVAGVAPWAFTLRELAWMARASQRAAWDRTAAMLALYANCHRDPKKGRAYTPADFHPYEDAAKARRTTGVPITAANIEDLKALVPKG